MELKKLSVDEYNRNSANIKLLISISKWIGLLIMIAAFPALWYISIFWGDIIMAFGLGVALSLGILDAIVSGFYYE